MAKKDEKEEVEVKETKAQAAESKEEPAKETKSRRSNKVKVRLRIKQLIGGKRGFIDETGTIKLLEGMKFQFGEQEVDADTWESAEVYK